VAQIHLARQAPDHVPALREGHRQEEHDAEVQPVLAADDQGRHPQEDEKAHRTHGGNQPDPSTSAGHGRPKKPWGRATRTQKNRSSPTTSR